MTLEKEWYNKSRDIREDISMDKGRGLISLPFAISKNMEDEIIVEDYQDLINIIREGEC